METIEERAKKYASKKGDISLSPIYNEALAKIYKEGYIAGAAEQKVIDIEEACKACESELQRLKQLIYESVSIPANLISVDKSLSRIRLEMLSSIE